MPPSSSLPNQSQNNASEIVETIGGGDAGIVIKLLDDISTRHPDFARGVVFFLIIGMISRMFLQWAFDIAGKWIKTQQDNNVENWLKNEQLYDLMDDLLGQTEAVRGLIIKSHNSGGIPAPGVKTYCSIIHSVGTGISRTAKLWDSMLMDAIYARLVSRLLKEQSFVIVTNELQDSDLKTTYLSDNIQYSCVALLGSNKREVHYISYNFQQDYDPLVASRNLSKIKLQAKAIGKLISAGNHENGIINSLVTVFRA